MTGKVTQLQNVASEDGIVVADALATRITEKYTEWETLRRPWRVEKEEIRRYIYATDTTKTTNAKLPWKNKTVIPKVCQIRDNLIANYRATSFPKRKWLRWEAFSSYNRGRRLRAWARFTHTGEAGGLLGQTIALIASAGAALLVFTGLSLGVRRFLAWKERRVKVLATNGS